VGLTKRRATFVKKKESGWGKSETGSKRPVFVDQFLKNAGGGVREKYIRPHPVRD